MRIMGIDIGTTTVSVVMTDTETRKLLAKETVEHNSFLRSSKPEQKLQDPERIYEIVRELLIKQQKENGLPDGIGFTGQMHGMLYVDAFGKAVSPLYTWQDGSGEIPLENGKTCAELLQGVGAAASGYGVVTHFYLQKKDQIPKDAVRMTTISDYIAMRLCENTVPVIGLDMAASWGCFDLQKQEFLYEALEQAGVDISYLPEVRKGHFLVGETRAGVPVMGSIGDNQASLFGSVRNLKDTVLLNVGTGSQVSLVTEKFIECSGSVELRPCTENSYILVGASLCGGRAYAMLEQFYREAAETEERLYSRMQEQAEKFIEKYGKEAAWKVDTAFSGTRSDPSHRGMIAGIGVENFHPGALTVGVICGILNELHEQYEQMCQLTGKKATRLTGSGNGIRRNSLMRRLAEEMFEMPMEIPEHEEEAAYGAALTAGKLAAKKLDLLLGAVTGGISYILNTVRSFCLGSKNDFLKGRWMCCVLCILQVTTLIFTWSGWWALLPVIANIAATIGGYTCNARKIRIVGMLINSPLWIIYDIAVGSWAGILDEIVSEASMMISIFRYGWKNMDSLEIEA